MAVPNPNQLPLGRPAFTFAQTHAQMREHIASLRHSMFASGLTIAEAQQTIARADEVLARRLSDPRHSDR